MPNTREKLIEIEQATVWFEKRAKDTPMPGARKMFEIGAEVLREKVNGVTVQEWISVKDRLPEDNRERVLVKIKDANNIIGHPGMDTDRYLGDIWVRWGHNVTHWMPLPQPPKGE